MPQGSQPQPYTRPPPRTILSERKAPARSRVSNGNDVLAGVDGRSIMARRYRDLIAAVAADQGAHRMSEARLQLCRRFSGLAVLAEALETRLANGEQIDVNEYATLTSTLVRVVSRLGINRVPKNVTPALAEILEAEEEEEEDAE